MTAIHQSVGFMCASHLRIARTAPHHCMARTVTLAHLHTDHPCYSYARTKRHTARTTSQSCDRGHWCTNTENRHNVCSYLHHTNDIFTGPKTPSSSTTCSPARPASGCLLHHVTAVTDREKSSTVHITSVCETTFLQQTENWEASGQRTSTWNAFRIVPDPVQAGPISVFS